MISESLSSSKMKKSGERESSTALVEDTINAEASQLIAESPTKKRRVSSASVGWQDFRRKSTRFKSLLDDALVKVTSASTSVTDREAESTPTNIAAIVNGNLPTAEPSSSSSIAILVRQKTNECILLQQELDKIKAEHAQMKALNHELRDAGKLHATQMQKMTKALELASQNAAKARNEADEAEARTLTLESQLEALQVVVQETKLASQLLLSEQEEVTQKAQSVEQKYVEAQAELARSNAQKQKLQQSNEELMHSKQNLELQLQELLTKLENEEMETKRWKMSYQDLEGIEKTQQESIRRLEDDVEQANTLLVEATSTAAETESTSLDLKNNLEKMQQTVEGLHKKLENKQKDEQRDKERHQEVMETVQKETQVLKAQISSQKDQIKQLNFEKTTQEKRLSQLQAKSSNLERRLQESTNIVNTTTGGDFSIPPLNGNGKENPLPLPTHKCAICFKALTTLAKKCQCGKAGCTVRAHVSCVNKIRPGPSVSHPGTPAPQLPIVLCASRKARSTAITPGEKVK